MNTTLLLLLLLTILTPSSSIEVAAAHSIRRRGNNGGSSRNAGGGNTKYDRSITLFNDQGRLLQIDYAVACTDRGLPVVCVNLGDVVLVAVAKQGGGEKSYTVTEKVFRIDHGILLVTTGLAGDGRALAQAARMACQRMRLSHGEIWSPTVSEIAQEVASIQHELTRTPGARPLGVTATIVGCDRSPSQDAQKSPLQLFQSEPGGILEQFNFCCAGKGKEKNIGSLVDLLPQKYGGNENNEKDASYIFSSIFKLLFDSENDNKNGFDLWTIIPSSNRRGGVRIRCARNISNIKSAEEVKLHLLS